MVEVDPGERELRLYQLLLQRFGQNWAERKPAAGVYNCAGHVWASRRTSILADNAWRTILDEDGYRCLSDREEPMVGDLVLYADIDRRTYNHVGMILEMCAGVATDRPRIPRILSKWNSTSGEVIHFCHDVPYDSQSTKIEYWTDRPAR